MITTFFRKGTDLVSIRIQGTSLFFAKAQGNWVKYTGVEGLKFSIGGILNQFPDLEGKPEDEIKKEGIKRFLDHIGSMKSETDVMHYIKEDLSKHGYILIMFQKKGHRPTRVKNATT